MCPTLFVYVLVITRMWLRMSLRGGALSHVLPLGMWEERVVATIDDHIGKVAALIWRGDTAYVLLRAVGGLKQGA